MGQGYQDEDADIDTQQSEDMQRTFSEEMEED